MKSDAELVKTCLKGQKEAFGQLIRRYEKSVRAVALRILGDFHRSEDATQEVFIKAWNKLPSLRKPALFGPWVTKIAKRQALDIAKRQKSFLLLNPELSEALPNSDGQLSSEKRRLIEAVMSLPEKQAQLISLRYFARHNVRDLAQILDRSVGTVTKQLSRAHKRLRTILERDRK